MRLEHGLEVQRLLPYAAKNGRKPIGVTRSFIVYSLNLALGLTTTLTTAFIHRNASKSRILICKKCLGTVVDTLPMSDPTWAKLVRSLTAWS
jgi:hypothetical protein